MARISGVDQERSVLRLVLLTSMELAEQVPTVSWQRLA